MVCALRSNDHAIDDLGAIAQAAQNFNTQRVEFGFTLRKTFSLHLLNFKLKGAQLGLDAATLCRSAFARNGKRDSI